MHPPPLRFIIPYPPRPKLRPRHTKAGRTYTPAFTAEAEEQVAACCRLALEGWPYSFKRYLVRVDAVFVLPRPYIPQKWGRGRVPCGVRPDGDNYHKLLLDGMRPVLPDDATVQIGHYEKWKAAANESPHTEVTVIPVAKRVGTRLFMPLSALPEDPEPAVDSPLDGDG